MCYGGLETKYMMRDIEERMKGVAFVADKSETPGPKPEIGIVVWLRGLVRWKKRKELVHG
jgi:hypothetical protein